LYHRGARAARREIWTSPAFGGTRQPDYRIENSFSRIGYVLCFLKTCPGYKNIPSFLYTYRSDHLVEKI
jgi:hypothetical protein